MAAVVAAIGAAFLAGAIALFREHRQQQRRLLVAARVMHAALGSASEAIRTVLKTNKWPLFNAVPGKESFSSAWEDYKGDLAGHLLWVEWGEVLSAVDQYLALLSMSQDEAPQDCEGVLSKVRNALVQGGDVLHPYCVSRLSVWKLARRRHEQRKAPSFAGESA